MKNIAVFISGSGTNLQALIDFEKKGKLKGKIALVISNKKDAFGIQRAKEAKIHTEIIEHSIFKTREEHEEAIEKILLTKGINVIVLAGYMRLLTDSFVKKWKYKIINLHPSLLPAFAGTNAINQAFDYGVRITGVSTIFVDEGVDTGPIIMQKAQEINSKDTLETLTEKIHSLEHNILPLTVNIVCEEKFTIQGRKVILNQVH